MPRNNASVASRPRSIMPFSIGSGGSGISASLSAASSTRSANSGICSGGAKIRSIGLVDVVLDRVERHHAGLPDPRPDPARDMDAAAALRRHVERRARRQDFAQARRARPSPRARPRRLRYRDAVRCRGSAPRATGTLQGSGLVGHAARSVHLRTSASRRRGKFPRSATQRRFVESRQRRDRRLGIERQAAAPFRAARRSGYSSHSACASGSSPAAQREIIGRRRGRRTPRRRPACASAR